MTRYACQSGFYVERRFGWDTHGLPIEFEIDKTLGISVCSEHRTLFAGVVHPNLPRDLMPTRSLPLDGCRGGML